ncbi:MAG: 2-amino-4-hydroxy-6-hydroxymethyldihydropteridine diphosphokinase [Betaproteobacteria bacterium]|nr:2-amino-4-hydroxy-6-hydroxymethyldihydropteridine diphosphokinase [Betaproteobacteria bacterium]
MTTVAAFVGLGANLGDPVAQVTQAMADLAALDATRVVRSSSLYRTAPIGHAAQPEFVNAVVLLDTGLPPRRLLDALLDIERAAGRERSFPNAPRRLDLDLLLYGEQRIDAPGLVVPHPRMHERAFVLAPLAEIAPNAVVPGHGRAAELLRAVGDQEVRAIERT